MAGSNDPGSRRKGIIPMWKYVARHCESVFHRRQVNNRQVISRQQSIQLPQDDPLLEVNDWTPLDLETSNDSQLVQDKSPPIPSIDDLRELGFHKESKTPVFLHHELTEKGFGIRYLTGKAFNVNPKAVNNDEAKFCLELSSLLVQLTDTQRQVLANILMTAGNNGNKDMSIFKTIRLPTSQDDFNQLFLTGKHAILPNLPHPTPLTADNGSHSYISLPDLLANEFAKSTEYDDFEFLAKLHLSRSDKIPSVSSTECARRLFIRMTDVVDKTNQHDSEEAECCVLLWMREWRDDFDPNNTKSSRNQAWCNTYSICPPSEKNTRGNTTYFMGLASKGDDHRVIEDILSKELEQLSQSGIRLYHAGFRKVVRVFLSKLLICVDRPERTQMFQIGDHNGTFSTCWGYATNIDGNCEVNHLPSCKTCRENRIRRLRSPWTEDTLPDRQQNLCAHCCDWSLSDPKLIFLAPPDYPQRFDDTAGAPVPPKYRDLWLRRDEIPLQDSSDNGESMTTEQSGDQLTSQNKKKRKTKNHKQKGRYKIYLRTVKLTVLWLKSAVRFACHNLRTLFPLGRGSQRYWTKANFVAYLKTCGCTNKMIDSLYSECQTDTTSITYPIAWRDVESLSMCHYAPMHMIFLGHAKSNLDMISKWFGKFTKLATFGRQANKFLYGIRALRATKYFTAQPLSTSTWGTGVWVSENYLFGARIWKYMVSLPSVADQNLMTRNAEYKEEFAAVTRFVSAMSFSFSRIMTNQRVIPHFQDYIHLYLDTMVELDSILTRSDKGKKNPNFVKSNSLGILACDSTHTDMGPAVLHWEGGWEGERKIQQLKPLLHIKRSNTDWPRLTLKKIYQLDSLEWMLDNLDDKEDNQSRQNRETNSMLRIYKSRADMEENVNDSQILCGLLGNDGNVYLSYRPVGEEQGNTRTKIKITKVDFRDDDGEYTVTGCWRAPLALTNECISYDNVGILAKSFLEEVVLLLPRLSVESNQFEPVYYCIGNQWTERTPSGMFELPSINNEIFRL